MKPLSPLLGCAVLAAVLCGCSTPQGIKDLSRTALDKHPSLGEAYLTDLAEVRDFVYATQTNLNNALAEAEWRGQAGRDFFQCALQQWAQSLKSDALARWDQRAYVLATSGLDDAWANRFMPQVKAFEEKLRAASREAEAEAARNTGNAAAQRQFREAQAQLLSFRLQTADQFLAIRDDLGKAIKDARERFVQDLNAEFNSVTNLQAGGASPLDVLAKAGAFRPNNAQISLESTFKRIEDKRLVVSAFNNQMKSDLATLDEYLQSNGYRNVFVKSFFTGLASAAKEKLTGLQELLKPLAGLGGLQGQFASFASDSLQNTAQSADKFLAGLSDKIDALVDKSFSKLEGELGKATARPQGSQ